MDQERIAPAGNRGTNGDTKNNTPGPAAPQDYAHAIESVARTLLGEPNGSLSSRSDLRFGSKGSLSVDTEAGIWHDHEADEGGGCLDLIKRQGAATDRRSAAEWLKRNGLIADRPTPAKTDPPDSHPTLGTPSARWTYTDRQGRPVLAVYRFEIGGEKTIRQATPTADGWQWKGLPKGTPRPLYGLHTLQNDGAAVIITEGEKARDSAAQAFDDAFVTCWPGGTSHAGNVDLAPIRGRDVYLWPDNDEAGHKAMRTVADRLEGIAAGVRIMDVSALPEKADAADVDEQTALSLIAEAKPVEQAEIEAQDPEPPTEEGPSTLPTVALTGLNNRPLDPIPQIVEKIVPAGVPTVLAAHGGVGKTQAALQLAVRVSAGRPFMGLDVEQCPVTYYSAEDDARILEHRLQRILRADDIDADSLAGHLHVIDATQIDPALFRESNIKDDIGVSKRGITTAAYKALIEHCREASSRLLVIDNASDVFEASENERQRVRQFMRALAEIAREIDGGVVLLSHVDKTTAKNGGSQSEGYSGSTAWHNSARSRLFLHGEDGFLTLEHQKSNHGPRAEDIAMTWHDGLLVEGHIRSRSEEMARATEEAAHTRDILRLIRDCAERGQFISTSATAGNAWTVLRPMDGFPRVDRQTFWRLLNRAEQDGRIIREDYQDANRKVKSRFTVTEAGGEFIDMDDAA